MKLQWFAIPYNALSQEGCEELKKIPSVYYEMLHIYYSTVKKSITLETIPYVLH